MDSMAQRIRGLRKRMGYTQKQLGDMLGLSPSTIGMYEQGRREPDHATLIRLCEIFSVSADWLIGRDEDGGESGSGARVELSRFVGDMRRQLQKYRGLMFSADSESGGHILGDDDIEMVMDAIELGVQLAANRGRRSEKGRGVD